MPTAGRPTERTPGEAERQFFVFEAGAFVHEDRNRVVPVAADDGCKNGLADERDLHPRAAEQPAEDTG
ncbi:hypothetical protein GCM10025867_00540 [Frondihabitans sucicola]|uniref:Uncharacterized protein n=1 Tax=Frondihabitans sucicola TaxID=1268041 RepID=A0ABN6XWS6_9MICO|nr:hypothetical protein GCM10025867_00540 [Frondihabitans sucicola]